MLEAGVSLAVVQRMMRHTGPKVTTEIYYLVTSRVRRELLRLLWLERVEGSVSDLARRAGVSFAAAHRELDAMRGAGLATSCRVAASVSYAANVEHPGADVLVTLLSTTDEDRAADDRAVRGWLRALGAPLATPATGRPPPLERVVGAGLRLAHRDATVARVLPIVLWRNRDGNLDAVVDEATQCNERQALGMFLQLAGELGGDRCLVSKARTLHDRRRTRLRPFFAGLHGPRALAAARRNSPAVAKKWGFLMNMARDSFADAFANHVGS
jgi:DNA-binding transcriptional ArsR family regulator